MDKKSVRVAVFADSAFGNRTGIGNYTKHLLAGLGKSPGVELIEVFAKQGQKGQYGKAESLSCGPFNRSVYTWFPCAMWQLRRRQDLKIVHNPTQVPGFIRTKALQVLTIHDLIPLMFPQESKKSRTLVYRLLYKSSIKAADRIITVSENTKRDIVRLYGVSKNRVTVIPLAADLRYQAEPQLDDKKVLDRYGITKPYILYVGTIEGRKNVDVLLGAYSFLLNRGVPHTLVLVGKRGWRTARFDKALGQIKELSRVRITGYVDDEALPALYRHADVFVYPSSYEGFGLPPLEAMACGTPVICSSSSSLTEVVGDAGILVDPMDSKMLAQALEQVLSSVSVRDSLSKKGRERASEFSWDKMIKSTVAVYEDVVKEHYPNYS